MIKIEGYFSYKPHRFTFKLHIGSCAIPIIIMEDDFTITDTYSMFLHVHWILEAWGLIEPLSEEDEDSQCPHCGAEFIPEKFRDEDCEYDWQVDELFHMEEQGIQVCSTCKGEVHEN